MANLASYNNGAVPYKSSGYGAAELKALYQKYSRSALSSVRLRFFPLSVRTILLVWLSTDDEPVHMVELRNIPNSVRLRPYKYGSRSFGCCCRTCRKTEYRYSGFPFPMQKSTTEQTIATQTELSQQSAPSIDAGAGTGGVQVEQDIKIDDEPPPDFVAFEKRNRLR